MTIIYESFITEVGAEVALFAAENMVIIFNETIPDELRSIAVIHKQQKVKDDIEKGNYLYINGERFEILHVGNKVNETFRELGHCTIKFSGVDEEDLPGTLIVEQKPVPVITENMKLKFVKDVCSKSVEL